MVQQQTLTAETNQLQEAVSDKNYEDGANCLDAKRNLSRGHKSVLLLLYKLPLNKYFACIKPFVWTCALIRKNYSPLF